MDLNPAPPMTRVAMQSNVIKHPVKGDHLRSRRETGLEDFPHDLSVYIIHFLSASGGFGELFLIVKNH